MSTSISTSSRRRKRGEKTDKNGGNGEHNGVKLRPGAFIHKKGK